MARVWSTCWVGNGIEEAFGSHTSKIFPVGKPDNFAAGSQHGAGPASGFLGQHAMVKRLK